jgi:hypothetical protein
MPATATALHSDVVDAALRCASALVGMEVVLVTVRDGDRYRFGRVLGSWEGLEEGAEGAWADTFCSLMLGGAPPATADAPHDPHYSAAPLREAFGVTSYVGVPVRARSGGVLGTLCCVDHGHVPVTDATIGVLHELADIVATRMESPRPEVVVRRTPSGWIAGDEEAPCLTSAMVLADLLAEDLDPPPRPAKPQTPPEEADRLRLAVAQLEHALVARVAVEQAIGVLAERLRVRPRDAFELLRKVARRGGVRVHTLSKTVVASAGDPGIRLPAEFAKRA